MGGAWCVVERWCFGWVGMSQGGVWQNTKCTPPTKGCGNTAPLRGGSPKDAASDPFCRRKWPGDERGKQRALAARGAAVGGRYWPCARAAAIKRTRKQCIALGRGVVGAGPNEMWDDCRGRRASVASEAGKRRERGPGKPENWGGSSKGAPHVQAGLPTAATHRRHQGEAYGTGQWTGGERVCMGGTGGISMQRGGKGGGQNGAGGADRGDQITA